MATFINTNEDILSLHGQLESRVLELKSLHPQSKALPKTEGLIKTIQGMMNGEEEKGIILIGAQENKGEFDVSLIQAVIFPCAIVDMSFQPKNFDEYRRHLYQMIQHNTTAYYEGLVTIHRIKMKEDHYIIAIEVNQSLERPHKNSNGRRYIRRDGYTEEMSYEEENAMHGKRERLNYTNSLVEELSQANAASYKPSIPLNGEPFVKLIPFGDRTRARDVSLLEGPYAFLRLIPKKAETKKHQDLKNFIREYGLAPLGHYTHSWTEINQGGAVVFQETAHDETKAYNLTQVNCNGNIEGIDTYIINASALNPKKDIDFQYVPITAVEDIFEKAMFNYLSFAETKLQLDLPITFEINIVGIKNYALAVPRQRFLSPFAGNSIHNEISMKGVIKSYKQPLKDILLPFFEKIWDSFGLKRPS